MFDSPFNLKTLFRAALFSLAIIIASVFLQLRENQTKIVFCDVGQGDAAYIRLKYNVDIVIDAGPDRKILNCLGRHMPFWDKKIELAVISHPNKDHFGGFLDILNRYKIDGFVTIDTAVTNKSYKNLINKILSKNISLIYKYSGDRIKVTDSEFIFFWPPISFNSNEDNDYSSIILFKQKGFRVLFTGDATPYVLGRLTDQQIKNVDILKIPHHGSKNGLTMNFLELANPKVGVISVGKNNPYGHPNQIVLDLLKAKKTIIKRTDKDGDIIIKIRNSNIEIRNII